MTSIEKIKQNKPTPTTVLINASNIVSVELVRTLLEHEGFVVVVDKFTDKNFNAFADFINSPYFLYLDIDGFESLNNLLRIDYVIFFSETQDTQDDVSSTVFISKLNFLNQVLDIALKYNSKFEIISSIDLYRKSLNVSIENRAFESYSADVIQKKYEQVIREKISSSSLDARMAYLGEILGEGMNLEANTDIVNFIKSAITKNPLINYGANSALSYFVEITDAVSGIIKSIFSKKSLGKSYIFSYPQAYSGVELVKIFKRIDPTLLEKNLLDNSAVTLNPLNSTEFDRNSEIGWVPRVGIETAIQNSIEYAKIIQNSSGLIASVGLFDQNLSINKKKQSYDVQDIASEQIQEESQRFSEAKVIDNFDRFRGTGVVVNPNIANQNNEVKKSQSEIKSTNAFLTRPNLLQGNLASTLNSAYKSLNQESIQKIPTINSNPASLGTKKVAFNKIQNAASTKISFLRVSIILAAILFILSIGYILVLSPIIDRKDSISNIENMILKNDTNEFLTFNSINDINTNLGNIRNLSNSWVISSFVGKSDKELIPITLKILSAETTINNYRDDLQKYRTPGSTVKYNYQSESLEVYTSEKKLAGQVYLARFEYDGMKNQIQAIKSSAITSTTESPYSQIFKFFNSKYIPYWEEISKQ
jgi:nucleoside-diphosphate-sugar epimerase